jgi:hypothetical protein
LFVTFLFLVWVEEDIVIVKGFGGEKA